MVPHELQDLLERMKSHREELLRQVLGLAEDEAARRPAEGEWSVKEQLYHLVEGEESWVRWALMARELPGSEVGPLPGTGNPPGFPGVERVPVDPGVRARGGQVGRGGLRLVGGLGFAAGEDRKDSGERSDVPELLHHGLHGSRWSATRAPKMTRPCHWPGCFTQSQ